MASPLLVFVGPTASGKTALAVRVAEALGGEIVSADSVQVYRHFEIGTGKPSAAERARAEHHLIDVVEPDESMDAARWVELADAALQALRARERVPIVCGGTFLWVRALLHGLAEAPAANAKIRERHRQTAEREGRAALHAALREVDPESAARLNENDFVRVSRALEVFEQSGVPLSRWHAEHAFRTERHAYRLFGVLHAPDALDMRIRERARAMLDLGWVDEVKSLMQRGHASARAMQSVGYKQVFEAVNAGALEREPLLDAVTRATRVFARRQRTWLRTQPVTWLDPERALAEDVRSLLSLDAQSEPKRSDASSSSRKL
ncbi:MAG: tRNA (adenosine(37)-N6)-dimethylallyltransferase MiaA [Polyangiaceae bacterium]